MILEVYNEEVCLPVCLRGTLPFVDEAIIIDGSADGPSTDNTIAIVKQFQVLHPDKIKLFSGTFERDNGAWDDTRQANLGYQHTSGDFIMRTHADIVYEPEDMEKLRDIIERFPDKSIFYTPMIEFFYNTNHIRLYSGTEREPKFPLPLIGDLPVVSRRLNPRFEDLGEFKRSSLQLDGLKDMVYMPHVRRFHFGWVKPFKEQVLKHVRYLMRGDHGQPGADLKAKGKKAVWDWAIKHVLTYETDPSKRDYAGDYPHIAESLRGMTSMDGYEAFMEEYHESRYT